MKLIRKYYYNVTFNFSFFKLKNKCPNVNKENNFNDNNIFQIANYCAG